MRLIFIILCFFTCRMFKPVINNIKSTIQVIDFLQKYDHPFMLTVF